MITLFATQQGEYGDWEAAVGATPTTTFPTLYDVWSAKHNLPIESVILTFNDRSTVDKQTTLELSVSDFSLLMDDCQKALINEANRQTPAGQRRTI
jgi:hypothetical protein